MHQYTSELSSPRDLIVLPRRRSRQGVIRRQSIKPNTSASIFLGYILIVQHHVRKHLISLVHNRTRQPAAALPCARVRKAFMCAVNAVERKRSPFRAARKYIRVGNCVGECAGSFDVHGLTARYYHVLSTCRYQRRPVLRKVSWTVGSTHQIAITSCGSLQDRHVCRRWTFDILLFGTRRYGRIADEEVIPLGVDGLKVDWAGRVYCYHCEGI